MLYHPLIIEAVAESLQYLGGWGGGQQRFGGFGVLELTLRVLDFGAWGSWARGLGFGSQALADRKA